MYLDVVHSIQQGNLVAGRLYLTGDALILGEQRGVALHIWGRVWQLGNLQSQHRLLGCLQRLYSSRCIISTSYDALHSRLNELTCGHICLMHNGLAQTGV